MLRVFQIVHTLLPVSHGCGLFNSLTCAILTPRRQQEVGQSPPPFHPLPELPPLRTDHAQLSTQRPQTGPEAAAGSSHGRPRDRSPSPRPGCNHPPTDGPGLPAGRGARLSPHSPATTYTDRLSHAGPQDGQCCAHCRGQCGCSVRSVVLRKTISVETNTNYGFCFHSLHRLHRLDMY